MVNHASSGRMKAIEELVRGRDFANQLRYVINGEDGSSSSSSSSKATTPALAEQLVKKVLMSFTNTLLHLNNPTNSEVSDWINNNPAKSEDSQESNCKSTSTIKGRRGRYVRRRTSQTWEKESETPTDQDGHQWRKYGKKDILNTTYPRNYYRCTHKFDQGCQATKHVQRVQDDPPLYKTTYYGNHTCRNLVNPEIILDPNSPSDHSSIFLCFDNTLPTPAKKDCPFLSSSSFPSPIVRKECKEEIIPSSSSNDYIISPELTFDNCSSRHVTLSSTLGSDHRDVMSGAFYDSAELDQVFEPFLDF